MALYQDDEEVISWSNFQESKKTSPSFEKGKTTENKLEKGVKYVKNEGAKAITILLTMITVLMGLILFFTWGMGSGYSFNLVDSGKGRVIQSEEEVVLSVNSEITMPDGKTYQLVDLDLSGEVGKFDFSNGVDFNEAVSKLKEVEVLLNGEIIVNEDLNLTPEDAKVVNKYLVLEYKSLGVLIDTNYGTIVGVTKPEWSVKDLKALGRKYGTLIPYRWEKGIVLGFTTLNKERP